MYSFPDIYINISAIFYSTQLFVRMSAHFNQAHDFFLFDNLYNHEVDKDCEI